EDHQQEDDEHDDEQHRGLTPEDEYQGGQGHRPDTEGPAVRVRPLAERSGGERPDGQDQADGQHDTESLLEEVNKRVPRGGGGIGGQRTAGDAAEVDATGDQQADGQDEHGRDQAEPDSDQGPPTAPRDVHPGPEEEQRQYGQRDPLGLDQPVVRLSLPEVL